MFWDGNPETRLIYSYNHRRNEPIPALESRRPVIGTVQRVPASVLSLSEPNPGSHKNPPNASNNPHWTALNWLTTRHHFLMMERWKAGATNFGPVSTLNDVLVQPERGIVKQERRDVDVLLFVVSGTLTYWDSVSNAEHTLNKGQWVHLTAGTGASFTVRNQSADTPLRFLELGIMSPKFGVAPRSVTVAAAESVDGWNAVPIALDADVRLRLGTLSSDAGALSVELETGRRAYLLAMEGSVKAGASERLDLNDGAHVQGDLVLTAQRAWLLMIETKKT